ncbi:9040_t:CDS:2 [Ambispora leptoticha]|uniref:9040_t:CDS:1 n=1 Tax=Ambispora leptoticha TaxID=144679 RepID=A0A9N9FAK3_9GLOM|nr:9040_t:CDS:2 [Ambispora leptoticha]
MKTALVLALFFILFGFSAATDFNLISPWGNSVWTSGTDQTVIWGVLTKGADASAPDVKTCNLDLMQGDFNNANLVAHIGSNLDVNMGKYLWKNVPDYPAGNNYFVRVGNPAWWRYGHAFTFQGKGTVKSLAQPAYNASAHAADGPSNIGNTNSTAIAAAGGNTTSLVTDNSSNSTSSSSSTSSASSSSSSSSSTSKPSSNSDPSKNAAATTNAALSAIALTFVAALFNL